MSALPHQHNPHTAAVLDKLPKNQEFAALSSLFGLLGDSNRLRLFWILCHCEECLINLATIMEMSSPALSHHLRQLKEGGLVVSRRAGKEVYYRAANTATTELLHHFMEHLNYVSCPVNDAPQSAPSQRIRAVHALLTGDLSQRHTIDALSKQFYMDSSTLKREFRQAYGLPIATYLKEFRLKKAAELLSSTDLSIGQITVQVGYETQSKFSAAFRGWVGVSPSEYRKTYRK